MQYEDERPTRPVGRNTSWGLLLTFSCCFPPGVNYMYMGMIKRGLAALSAFFCAIYIASLGLGPLGVLFGFAVPVLWLAIIFDGFQLRRRILAGEPIHDNIDDIAAFVKRNKRPIILFVLAVAGLSLLSAIIPFMGRILPILIVVWGLHVLLKKPRKKNGDEL